MKVLVIKLTSMGDLLHLFPALSDLQKHNPKLCVDWMVEDSFAEIPAWHPSVEKVISVGSRRWRSLNWKNLKEFLVFFRQLRQEKYDLVIDAQGLMKSAGFACFARLNKGGKRVGFSADSIKESPAAKFYKEKINVKRDQHAIVRLRQLFAQAFDYSYNEKSSVDYQIKLPEKPTQNQPRQSIFFLHGTTWSSKHLPDQIWRDLVGLVTDDGYQVKLSWGNDKEKKRAEWIAEKNKYAEVLPKQNLSALAKQLQDSVAVIGVDTGLGHLAAALNLPAISIYGATNAELTGALSSNQIHLQTDYPCSPCLLKKCNKITKQVMQAPCYQTLSAADIWQPLYEKIA